MAQTSRTVVLDDDPTGTQAATDVPVLLDLTPDGLEELLTAHEAVYVLTNTRALDRTAAGSLVTSIRRWVTEAAAGHGWSVNFVLRGDSTLRGHVFAEIAAFESDTSVVLLAPAFPDGGRRTRDGVHLVTVGEAELNAADTEFARDPVFGFGARSMRDYVTELTDRPRRFVSVPADQTADALAAAAPHTVVVPDIETTRDVDLVHAGVRQAHRAGAEVVVRCAAPLAAHLAGVRSPGLLDTPLSRGPGPILVVCGSHTHASTEQLAQLTAEHGSPVVLPTDLALDDPAAAGEWAAGRLRQTLPGQPVVVLSSERRRRDEHHRLEHAQRVMDALVSATHAVAADVSALVTKGGITSAEVARRGFGARTAHVLGQVLPGVSLWKLSDARGCAVPMVVVPGNLGAPDTLSRAVAALEAPAPVPTPRQSHP